MAVPRWLKPMFLALVAALTMATVSHAQTAPLVPPSHNDRWMTEIAAAFPAYGTLRLSEVLWPGSHDSATSTLENAIGPYLVQQLPQVLKDMNGGDSNVLGQDLLPILAQRIIFWSRTQSLDINGQLEAGVRSLDLRPCSPKPGETAYRICHGLYGPTLDSALQAVLDFVKKDGRSKEIVLIGFGDFYGLND